MPVESVGGGHFQTVSKIMDEFTTQYTSTSRPTGTTTILRRSDISTSTSADVTDSNYLEHIEVLFLRIGFCVLLFVLLLSVCLLFIQCRKNRRRSRDKNVNKVYDELNQRVSSNVPQNDVDGETTLLSREYASLKYPEDTVRTSQRHHYYHELVEGKAKQSRETNGHSESIISSNSPPLSHEEETVTIESTHSGDEPYDKLQRDDGQSFSNDLQTSGQVSDYSSTKFANDSKGYDHVQRCKSSPTRSVSDNEYSLSTPQPSKNHQYDHLDRNGVASSDDVVASSSAYDELQDVKHLVVDPDLVMPDVNKLNHQYEATFIT